MRQFIILAFIGVLLMKDATSLKNEKSASRLAWLFGLKNNKLNENEKEIERTVCQSQECEKFAQILSSSIDPSVDPCNDFYEYACGKWPEANPIPEGKHSWESFDKAEESVTKKIRESLDEGPKIDDILAVRLAKQWYTVCMDTASMDRQGLDPIVHTLARMGGWPITMDTEEWNEKEYTWQKVDDQYMRLMGRNAFHDVRINTYSSDSSDSSENSDSSDSAENFGKIHIDTPHLPPYSYRLMSSLEYESEEDESDEDVSDENKNSGEQDSQEPGSEEETDKIINKDDNNKIDDDDDVDYDDDDDDDDYDDDDDDDDDDVNDNNDNNNNNDNDDDGDDDTNEDNNDDTKKKIDKKKAGKFTQKKNKKLEHSKKAKSDINSKKQENHKMKKQRIKRRAVTTTLREKLHARKNKKNHAKKEHKERLEEILETTTQTGDSISEETTNEESTIEEMDNEEMDDDVDVIQLYANYILNVARAITKARGIPISEEHMQQDIQNMIDFQFQLTNIASDFSDDLEMTLDEFQEWYEKKKSKSPKSKINWPYKIKELFDEAHVPNIDSSLNVEIGSPGYFRSLVSLLDKSSSRTIVNYIHWNFLSNILKTTTSEMRKLYDTWEMGRVKDEESEEDNEYRSSRCINEVEMSHITAYVYVTKHFDDEIAETAVDMVDDIQKEVEYQIKESNWMDEKTKDFILAKLVNMDKFIGYPDWYKNSTIIKRYYQGLVLVNSYYENTLSYKRYYKWKRLRRLTENPEDYDSRWLNPLIVNAYFSPYNNMIAITAADFQSPWFDYDRPQAINYGMVGSIMAHEVNHGFDDDGLLYDKNGDSVEWLAAMAQAYNKKVGCFVDQFNNYPIDKETNFIIENYGNKTIGDNMADSMGLMAAYRAYKRRERECKKPDTALPGHEDITNDQLFFLSFANLWCGISDRNATISQAKYDNHSPGRLRVIGSVSNSEDFGKAFNCPIGSPMNPEKKCNIWK